MVDASINQDGKSPNLYNTSAGEYNLILMLKKFYHVVSLCFNGDPGRKDLGTCSQHLPFGKGVNK